MPKRKQRRKTVKIECDRDHDPKPFIYKKRKLPFFEWSFVWSRFWPRSDYCQDIKHYRNGLHVLEDVTGAHNHEGNHE